MFLDAGSVLLVRVQGRWEGRTASREGRTASRGRSVASFAVQLLKVTVT